MITVIDSGNSRIHCASLDLLENSKLLNPVSIPYPESFESLRDVLTGLMSDGDFGKNEKIAACSVSSKWRERLFETLNDMYPGKLVVARTASDIGVKVSYDNPDTYGVDRALASYGAYRHFGDSCVVIDAGTAVTVDAVDNDGAVIGGYIFPGKDVLACALSAETDLPGVSDLNGDFGIGGSTEQCIALGISMGYRAAIRHLIDKAIDHAGSEERVILTGGNAGDLGNIMTFPVVLKPNIVLEALGFTADNLPEY
ncbi:type III pantothenate kinase [Candidatus Latescibacterota bacterium]